MSTTQNLESMSVSENIPAVENSLKELLTKMLCYLENFIKSQEDSKSIAKKLNDYENLETLVEMMHTIFDEIASRVDSVLQQRGGNTDEDESGRYQQLERIVQKHESEIRNHIRTQHQMKILAESLQARIEESELERTNLLASTKSMISSLKRDNQDLCESLKTLQEEKAELERRASELENQVVPTLQEKIRVLEKKLGFDRTPVIKKLALEQDSNKNSLSIQHSTVASSGAYRHASPSGNHSPRQASRHPLNGSFEREVPPRGKSGRPGSRLPTNLGGVAVRLSKELHKMREMRNVYVTGALLQPQGQVSTQGHRMNKSLINNAPGAYHLNPLMNTERATHKRSRSQTSKGPNGSRLTTEMNAPRDDPDGQLASEFVTLVTEEQDKA
eukprot:TRINITY_DN9552_c0_g2_i5.p1 TRINITY_DN9552_c0_g2~~TRINITY_DN9552_c0_g2_i5.p1  ORF type:complete len:388 (-),score=83.25 TRINITY_DN9552_c0_g2_i5:91-1254(-)